MEKKVLAGILVYFCILIALSSFVNSEEGAKRFCRIRTNKIIYTGDDLQHPYMSHYSLKNPAILFVSSTKPVYAISYFFYALQFGFNYFTPRIMNSIFSACVLILTYLLSKRFIKDKLLAVLPVVLVGLHPLYILLSVSGFTEIMFMFAVLLGINLWYQKNYSLSTIVISLTPLIRPEGFALLIWWGILNFRKGWKNILLLGIPTLFYLIGNFVFLNDLFYFVKYPFLMSIGNWSRNLLNDSIYLIIRYSMFFGILIPLFLIGFLKNVKNKKHRVIAGSLLCILFVQNFSFLIGSNRFLDRYATLILPLFMVYVSLALEYTLNFLDIKLFNLMGLSVKLSKSLIIGAVVVYSLFILIQTISEQDCKYVDSKFLGLPEANRTIEKLKSLGQGYDAIYIPVMVSANSTFHLRDLSLIDPQCDLMDRNLVLCLFINTSIDKTEMSGCISMGGFEPALPRTFKKETCIGGFCVDESNRVISIDYFPG